MAGGSAVQRVAVLPKCKKKDCLRARRRERGRTHREEDQEEKDGAPTGSFIHSLIRSFRKSLIAAAHLVFNSS